MAAYDQFKLNSITNCKQWLWLHPSPLQSSPTSCQGVANYPSPPQPSMVRHTSVVESRIFQTFLFALEQVFIFPRRLIRNTHCNWLCDGNNSWCMRIIFFNFRLLLLFQMKDIIRRNFAQKRVVLLFNKELDFPAKQVEYGTKVWFWLKHFVDEKMFRGLSRASNSRSQTCRAGRVLAYPHSNSPFYFIRQPCNALYINPTGLLFASAKHISNKCV